MGAKCWNEREDTILLEGRRKNISFEEIALSIGRSPKACMARWQRLTAGSGSYNELQAIEDIKDHSAALGEAINGLIARMQRTTPRTLAFVLGPKPATDHAKPAPFGTASAERRLAA